MAVKKETTAKKTTAKKTVAKTTAPKKTTTVKKAVVKKDTVKEAPKATKTVKKSKEKLPGGFLMILFLLIACFAAVVNVIGTIIENNMENIGSKLSSDLIQFIAQCKSVSVGIFAIFLVLALLVKFTKKK